MYRNSAKRNRSPQGSNRNAQAIQDGDWKDLVIHVDQVISLRISIGYQCSDVQAPVVQKLDSSIHRINHCPVDNAIGFPNTYPLDSDLSDG